MRSLLIAAFCGAWLACGNLAQAEEVQVRGVHLCCGGCVNAVEEALESVKGLGKYSVDRGSGVVTFEAASPEIRTKGLAALAEAGFAGSLQIDGKDAKFPMPEIDPSLMAQKVVFEGVHLCCTACTKGVARALEKNEDIGVVKCDQVRGTVEVESRGGAELRVSDLQTAMFRAGYFSRLQPPPAKK